MEIILVTVFYIGFLIAATILANRLGRSVLGWFFLSILISPILSLIFLFCLGETKRVIIEKTMLLVRALRMANNNETEDETNE